MKDLILQLHAEGKTRPEIQRILGCSKSTMSYHLSDGQKTKTRRRQTERRLTCHPYERKLENFKRATPSIMPVKAHVHGWRKVLQLKIEHFVRINKRKDYMKPNFTVEDVIAKFGERPTCYLTGQQLDIQKPREFAFDHKIPVSRGGDNSLENLALCTKQANYAKGDMTPDEFLALCKQVVIYGSVAQ